MNPTGAADKRQAGSALNEPSLTIEAIRTAFPELGIDDVLGAGTFKVAFRATRDGVNVVLKVLKAPIDDAVEAAQDDDAPAASTDGAIPQAPSTESPFELIDPTLPPRVEREIAAMRGLSSRHVVSILDGPGVRGISGRNHWWYLEPHYPGGTLAQRIASGAMSAAEASALCRALLIGVQDIWTQGGLVHRDIKPDNIVFDGEGQPILLDLGIVLDTAATPITNPGWLGPRTNRYCAPEQLVPRGLASIDVRTDMFLVGISVFEAWTGVHPFAPFDGGFWGRVTTGRFATAALSSRPDGERLKILLPRLLGAKPHERYRTPDLALAVLDEATA